MESVLVAAFAAVASIIGSYMANRKSSALLEYRLQQVEMTIKELKDDRADISNIRTELEVIEERIKVANKRIAKLEHGEKN